MASLVSGLYPLVDGENTDYLLNNHLYKYNGGRTYTTVDATANTTAEPSQQLKCDIWQRTRAKKNPNGNCLWLSLGEGLGFFSGFDNQKVSNDLRANVTRTLNANLDTYAEDICIVAATTAEKKLASENRALWVQSWIEKNVAENGAWADDDICISAAAMHYKRTIVVFYADEVASAVLFHDGTRVIMFWEQLCKRFPLGVARDSLIVVLFNGNYTTDGSLQGNHFDHAKLFPPSTTLPPPPALQERPTQLPQGMPKWQTLSRCVCANCLWHI